MKLGIEKAEADFSVLLTVANHEPTVVLRSPSLWNLYFSIHTDRALDETLQRSISRELGFDELTLKYPEDQHIDVQKPFSRQWCSNASSSTTDVGVACQAIAKFCGVICDPALIEHCDRHGRCGRRCC